MVRGLVYGLSAAFAWAIYNVGVKIGRNDGFTSADLTLLRYVVPAVLLLPFFILRMRRKAPTLSLFRAVALTIAIGPPFALLINAGYGLAPLAHAVVISPGTTMLTANALSMFVDGRPMPVHRRIGMLVLVAGLAFIAFDRPAAGEGASDAWLGDLCFVGSGFLWGLFSYLAGRWRLDPVDATAAVALLASVVFVPVYFAGLGATPMPLSAWLQQGLYQGLLGGCLAIIAYAAAIAALGAGLAALFPALVPPLAVLLAIPLAGSWPSGMQWSGVGLATLGLVVSLDVTRRLVRRRGG